MRPTTSSEGTETISISIGLGSDTRTASSIVLPRGHDLVRHLERLLPQLAKTVPVSSGQRSPPSPRFTGAHYPDRQQEHMYAYSHHQQQQQSPQHYQHAPAPRGVYAHRHHPYQMPSSRAMHAEAPQSPYLSDASSTDSTGRSSSSGSVYNAHMLDLQQPLPTHHELHLQYQQDGRRRRGPAGAQGVGKKCQFQNCEKISVSRGLCRGHGGGRRCQRPGCGKGAQSRSDFCWAHGGGQRCEVKNCMRSRKSKRFCVAHLSWEATTPTDAASGSEVPKAIMPKPLAPYPSADVYTAAASPTSLNLPALALASKLPSLQQALRKNQCVSSSASAAGAFQHATATTC